MFTAIALIATPLAVFFLYLWLKERRAFSGFKKYYKPLTDIDAEMAKRKRDLASLQTELANQRQEAEMKSVELTKEYQLKRSVFEALLSELAVLEENFEDISYGLYKPHYDYNTSSEFKHQLEQIRTRQKQSIKEEKATHCSVEWTVGGSKREGARMTKQYAKLMLRAFNRESHLEQYREYGSKTRKGVRGNKQTWFDSAGIDYQGILQPQATRVTT